jgi:hypothetical protein
MDSVNRLKTGGDFGRPQFGVAPRFCDLNQTADGRTEGWGDDRTGDFSGVYPVWFSHRGNDPGRRATRSSGDRGTGINRPLREIFPTRFPIFPSNCRVGSCMIAPWTL